MKVSCGSILRFLQNKIIEIIIILCYVNCSALQEFLPLRKIVIVMCKITIILRAKDIANQLTPRHLFLSRHEWRMNDNALPVHCDWVGSVGSFV